MVSLSITVPLILQVPADGIVSEKFLVHFVPDAGTYAAGRHFRFPVLICQPAFFFLRFHSSEAQKEKGSSRVYWLKNKKSLSAGRAPELCFYPEMKKVFLCLHKITRSRNY